MDSMLYEQFVERARRRQRITAALAAALMLLSVLLSVTLILRQARHECTGSDCPVCDCIGNASQKLTGGGTLPPCTFAALLTSFVLLLTLPLPSIPSQRKTLVSLKVLLLN